MIIRSADFLTSATKPLERPSRPEIALVGRSNVGKSSLINMLTGRRHLAKTSSTPGKTQTVNYFEINNAWYLVDLPGYGYARAPKTKLAAISSMITDFLTLSSRLLVLFVLIDIRRDPQPIDLEFLNWAGTHHIPVAILFTKTDKVTRGSLAGRIGKFEKAVLTTWESLPPSFITSSENRTGRDEVLAYIEKILNIAAKNSG